MHVDRRFLAWGVFFVDFEGHAEDPKVKRTLNALQEQCEKMIVLGSFPVAQATD